MEDVSPEAARAFAVCAAWLDTSLEAAMDEALSLTQAKKESGWSYEGLRQKIAKNPSLNAAEKGAPMIRRRDLALLGAARGPRGKRKPKAAGAISAPPSDVVEQPVPVSPVQEMAVAVSASSQVAAGAVSATHDERLQAPAIFSQHDDETQSQLMKTVSPPLAIQDDCKAPDTEPVPARPGATSGPRTAPMRKHRGSTRDRFQHLCALAALS